MRLAGRQIAAHVRGSLTSLPRSPARLVGLVFWAVAIGGDAWTTMAMMGSGEFEEANPSAAFGMGFVGLPVVVALASVACAVLAVAATARPAGLYPRAFVIGCWAVGLIKAHTAVSNYLLWTT